MSEYADFLARKGARVVEEGIDVAPEDLHPFLHPWQREVVAWALRVGRAAIWEDTGLGKTVQQVEWARVVGGVVLIVAPLAVCRQTIREARKVDVEARYVRHGDEITGPGVWVTNFEMVEHFDASALRGVVLDEASILKQADGKTRTMLIRHFADVPYRLACTATPAPNDPEELTNQAEFLGQMTRVNMLASFFVHDDEGWRLKGHARGPMLRWMSGWAVAIRRPSDIGGDDTGYVLPGLDIRSEIVRYDAIPEGQLFATDLGGVGGRSRVRRETLAARVERTAQIVANEPDEPWLLWCGLNDEADALAAAIHGSVNVHGSMTPEEKAERLLAFADGDVRVLITKPSMAAFGLNFQHCARMAFVGLNDSYETYYQAIRRCYRYGQTRPVHVYIVTSDLESQIAANVARKERQATALSDELVREMRMSWNRSAA